MKNVKIFFARIFAVLVGLGLSVIFIIESNGTFSMNSDLVVGIAIGVISLLFGIVIIINYLKYEIYFTNTYVTKQTITKKQEIKWEVVNEIIVNKKNMTVLKTNRKEMTIKPVVTGIHDFIYLLINRYGQYVITILSQNQLTYKKLTETIKKYQDQFEQAA
ncbi:hypothetical protein [Haloplasma contractile]|uniref:Uncharacterized protein n=1 Tax=Haloplasma contractile SSD-17B TaxID=1033810 RepID=U2DUD1_9MOLU|nr:hypothetical protein [Haloplasma contractile]ERJ12007.1 hypothetical protein HLPCO_001921 [Haloplasma contractile SSD-17B]